MLNLFSKNLAGAKVPHYKNTRECVTEHMPIPDMVYIPMVQHMGAPCTVQVKVGEIVKVGQILGDTDAFMSSPVHSSVSGRVKAISDIISPNGTRNQVVEIETDRLQTVDETLTLPVVENFGDFVKAVRKAGLVGLGGAGFPTHIKLNPKNIDDVDTLIVNGAECEPFITSDYRTMLEDTDQVLSGINYIKEHLNLKRVFIGIEDNKMDAIRLFEQKTADNDSIDVVTLKSLYPQGAEKVLIYEATGKVVPEGKLPSDVGVIVTNITTISFLDKFFKTGMPLISKRITVDGGAVQNPKNIVAPIGTTIADIVAFCGGYKGIASKLIMGGPMMGIAVYHDSYPLLKNNNAILIFDQEQAKQYAETPCIRCGKCVKACPIGLMPTCFDKSYHQNDPEQLKRLKINLCMECGCCSFVCPAKRHLVVYNRMAKKLVRESAK